jgi:hypothetical protein
MGRRRRDVVLCQLGEQHVIRGGAARIERSNEEPDLTSMGSPAEDL